MASRLIPCPVCSNAEHFHALWSAQGNRQVPFLASEHPVVLCARCGFCFLNPQHEDADYGRYYLLHDRPVDKTVTIADIEGNAVKAGYDRLRYRFLSRFLSDKNARIFEIGSGYGRFLKRMSDDGYRNLSGCEPNEQAVRVAQAQFGFDIQCASLQTLALRESSVDVALLIAVIDHFTDPVAALGRIGQLLKPGGLLYVNVLNLGDVVLRKGINKYFKFVHTVYFTEASLFNCLKKAGFEIVMSKTLPANRACSTWRTPENYTYSELNVMARRPSGQVKTDGGIVPEDWQKIARRLRRTWTVDRRYFFMHRVWTKIKKLPICGRFIERWRTSRMPNPLTET
ncbi:MAG: class I SAM-dependent methyltransferase [Patescibacteria group bacterium]|nr:class I SAM-dependent methyltransferase [Patescibacteria group bacterium]